MQRKLHKTVFVPVIFSTEDSIFISDYSKGPSQVS